MTSGEEFEPGDAVIVTSPFNFKGIRSAVVLEKQKWCKDGIAVMLADPKETIRNLCIFAIHGDTIKKIGHK